MFLRSSTARQTRRQKPIGSRQPRESFIQYAVHGDKRRLASLWQSQAKPSHVHLFAVYVKRLLHALSQRHALHLSIFAASFCPPSADTPRSSSIKGPAQAAQHILVPCDPCASSAGPPLSSRLSHTPRSLTPSPLAPLGIAIVLRPHCSQWPRGLGGPVSMKQFADRWPAATPAMTFTRFNRSSLAWSLGLITEPRLLRLDTSVAVLLVGFSHSLKG